jgi:hypothetical protein
MHTSVQSYRTYHPKDTDFRVCCATFRKHIRQQTPLIACRLIQLYLIEQGVSDNIIYNTATINDYYENLKETHLKYNLFN